MAPKKKPVKETGKSKASPKSAEQPKEQSVNQSFNQSNNPNLPLWLTEGSTQRDKNVLCENVHLYTPDGKTELVKNQRVQFVNGRRYGLIGANGIGKSTLLKHVYAYDLPNFPKYLRVIYVQQHDLVESSMPVLEFVVQSDEEKKWLESEQERLYTLLENADQDETEDSNGQPKMTIDEIQERLDSVSDRLEVMDARRSNTRATAILLGLGFTQKMLSLPIGSLSGGWKQRVALACALFVPSDLLLLDEPTNHLDFGAVRWLEQFLKTCTQTLVLVSHDRNFLNACSTDIIELVDQRLDYYRGDYNSYVKQKEELTRQRRHDWEVQQKKILELKQFVEEAKKSDNPATANAGRSRQLMLDKMELIQEPTTEKLFKFEFPDPGKLDHALIEINDMSFRYPKNARIAHESNDAVPIAEDSDDEDPDSDEPWLIRHATLHMDQSSRIGMLGVNGAGKSTLIKLIKGELTPTEGICRLNPHCRAVTFTQHHLDQLDLTKSSMEYLQSLFPTAKENQIRGVMGRYGFDAAMVQQKIGSLSGGQKSRVAFAILTWREPHLIIMDEPTNHLDLQTIEALIGALKSFKGGVLIVSHDQYFLESVATEFWSFRQPDYQTGIVSKDSEPSVQVFYELEEAKPFSYNLIDYEGEGSEKAANKAELMKAAQAIAIAEKKEKQAALLAENPEAVKEAPTGPVNRGKKKRKTKRGAGGIDMKELNIEEALAEMKLQEEVANTKLIDIEISESEEEEEDQPMEADQPEIEAKDVDVEDQDVEEQASKQKKQKSKKSKQNDDEDEDQPKKSKKKGKKSKDESENEAEVEAEKPKKKKKSADDDEDKPKKKKKSVEIDDDADEKPKKSKKKSTDSGDEAEDKPKKKKKSVEIDDEADDKPKKGKKSKKIESEDESNNQEDQPKKAKKSKKVEIADHAENDENESKKVKKSKKKSADSDDEVDDKPKKSKKKKSADSDEEAEVKPKKSKKKSAESDEDADEKPKKSKKKSAESDDEDKPKKKKKNDDDEADDKPKKKKKKAADSEDDEAAQKPKKSKKKSSESDDEAQAEEKPKKKKKSADDDEEKPKKKKKAAESDDEADEKPKKSKKKSADSEDEDKPKKKKKSAVADDDEQEVKADKKKKKKSKAADDSE